LQSTNSLLQGLPSAIQGAATGGGGGAVNNIRGFSTGALMPGLSGPSGIGLPDSASFSQVAEAAFTANEALVEQVNTTSLLAAKAGQVPPVLGGVGNALTGLASVATGAMGIFGGIQSIGKGGTYNTLMGLAGIFGSLGSLFLGGFGGFFAKGGTYSGGRAIVVGEEGPELLVPSTSGRVFNNSDTEKKLRSTRQILTDTKSRRAESTGNNLAMEALSRPIDLRYESTVINNQEFVTVEQHRKGIRESAMQGRNMTLQALQYSVRARRRVGI
jgi:phage-related minor tail protein